MQIAHQILRSAAMLGLIVPALAHHSMAPYDLSTVVSIEGVVSKYEWTNPHIYVHVDVKDASGNLVTWRMEAGSPAIMRARGWSPQSFTAGEPVSIFFNPARDRSKRIGFVSGVQKQGVAMAGVGGPIPQGVVPVTTEKATSLAGVWIPEIQPAIHRQLRLEPTILPTTPKGTAALRQFEERSLENPAAQCVPPVAPLLMMVPEIKAIEMDGDRIRILSEGFAATRTVYLNQNTARSIPASSLQGHSVGVWEGGTLVVTTTHFAENPVGNAIGLPSGAQKRMTERFELAADGTRLSYSFVLEDPEYLREPVKGEFQWRYRPDLQYAEAGGCNLENARQFVTE